MTPQERQLVAELFDRLASLEDMPRDRDAERTIEEGFSRAPNAAYPLVQTVLVQDEALKRANARIQELETAGGAEPPPPEQRGFLDNMRDALFGSREEPRGSVPSVRPGGVGSSGVWGPPPSPAQQTPWGGGQPSMSGQPPMSGQPMMAPGGGGSFLGTAAASAAGVIGGAMLLGGIRSMFDRPHGGQSAFDSAAGSPLSGGSAAGSDLARDAGLNDIGQGRSAGSGGDDRRAGLLGGDANDDRGGLGKGDNDHGGFDDDDDVDTAGDFDDGDTDEA